VNEATPKKTGFWRNRPVMTVLVLVTLAVTVGVPGVGAIGAFIIAIAAAVLARKQGSFADLGFRSPPSWPKLLGTTFAYGLALQLIFVVVVEPLLERFTGVGVDLSNFEAVRGHFANFVILLAIGWGVGGFLEELTFRGFVVGRLRWLLGSGTAATWAAVLVAAVTFGVAHAYQGISGMIATGLTGLIVGALYVLHRFNVWYVIFTHGFINTAGILAIYLDIDRPLARVLFG
jgi:membrane protease YdiL (CAAX protease family)